MCLEKHEKGECLYILSHKLHYYTKELVKLSKIAAIALFIIVSVIFLKYKVQYQVSFDRKVIGYVDTQSNIEEFVDEKVSSTEEDNIAYVDWKETPALQLKLVSKEIENDQQALKEKIADHLIIGYTNYAISINGETKTIVASKTEAESIVEELKEKYEEKYTKDIGIIQIYSEDADAIKAVEREEAQQTIAKILSNQKQKDRKEEKAKKIQLAKVKSASNTISKVNTSTKLGKINGIQLVAKPVTGVVTSRFGRRSSPGGIGSTNHKGLDIAAPAGTAIYAVASGTVIYAGNRGSLGNLVIIDHGNGVQTYYGHCSRLYVSNGQKIEAGSSIAAVGKTGVATGYHLHFEIHINGVAVNPQNYVY